MGELDWRQAKSAERWEEEYSDFASELAPTLKLLPHETRYDDLRARRSRFSQDVTRLGCIGLGLKPLPEAIDPIENPTL